MPRLQHLRLDCKNKTGPKTDLMNRSKRFDPLAHLLMTHPNLRILRLDHVEELFVKLSMFASMNPTQLQQNNYCPTVELVKDLLATHEYFRLLHLNSRGFQMTLDRSESRSPPMDPVRTEEPPNPPEPVVSKWYGAGSSGSSFDNGAQAQAHLMMDVSSLKISIPSSSSYYAAIINSTMVRLTPPTSPTPSIIRVSTQYGITHWIKFVADLLPMITSVVLKSPGLNDFSILRSFTLKGLHYSLHQITLQALLWIVRLRPEVEEFCVTALHIKNPVWEELVGSLNYKKLKIMNLQSNNFGATETRFPVQAIPSSAVLEKLMVEKPPNVGHCQEK
ncbi:hypothetical protein EDD11_002540, partial [Mortierella claussenii]